MPRDQSSLLQHVTFVSLLLLLCIACSVAVPHNVMDSSDSDESESLEHKYQGPKVDEEHLNDHTLLLSFLEKLEEVASKLAATNTTTTTTTTTTEEPNPIFDDLSLGVMMKEIIRKYHNRARSSVTSEDSLMNDETYDFKHPHEITKNKRNEDIYDNEDDREGHASLEDSSSIPPTEFTPLESSEGVTLHDSSKKTTVQISSSTQPTESSTVLEEKNPLNVRNFIAPMQNTTGLENENTLFDVTIAINQTENATGQIEYNTTVQDRTSNHINERILIQESLVNQTRREQDDERVNEEVPPPPMLALMSQQPSQEESIISKESLGKTFIHTSKVASIFAGIVVMCAVLGYVGFMSWRLVGKKRGGIRERLVNDNETDGIGLYEI